MFPPSWTNKEALERMIAKPKLKRIVIAGALLQAHKDMLQYWALKVQEDIDNFAAEIDRLQSQQ